MTRLLDLKLGDEIALKMYPIGSVYISVNNTNPSTLFGGTWERIADGKCLWGANSSGSDVNTTKTAGLPTLTGTVSGTASSATTGVAVGDFTYGIKVGTGSIPDTGSGYDTADMTLTDPGHTHTVTGTATITGTADTVQPPALVVCMWKRTA